MMNTPNLTLRPVWPMCKPVLFVSYCGLLSCVLVTGCQTSNRPDLSASLFGAKPAAQQVSQAKSKSAAGLPEPTNKETLNGPLSLASVDDALRKGEQELEKGNFQQAQWQFDAVLKQQPDHVKAHHRLGVLADKLNQFEQAEQHYLSALNGDPRNAALLSDLGYSYFMQGRYADGERYLLEARKVDPNYHTAIANLGLLYASTGRQQEALAMFRQIGDESQVQAIMAQVTGGRHAHAESGRQSVRRSGIQRRDDRDDGVARHCRPAAGDERSDSRVRRTDAESERGLGGGPRSSTHWHSSRRCDGGRPERRPDQCRAAAAGVVATERTATTGTSCRWHSTASPYNPQAGYANQPGPRGGYVPDDALSGVMASIDRRDQVAQPNGPIVIGRPEGVSGSSASPMEQASWATQPNGNPSQVPVYNGPSQSPPTQAALHSYPVNQAYADFSQQQQQGSVQPADNAPSYWSQRSQDQAAASAPGCLPTEWRRCRESSLGVGAAVFTFLRTAGTAGGTPQPGTIQQLNGNADPYGQRPVEQAYHTQPNGQSQEIALAGQSGAPQPWNPQSPNGNPAANNAPPGTASSYEQGRREAAMLGLSAGPGQVFPYIQQTQRLMPGTESRINGSQYPSPARHMPTGLIPPNYNAMSQTPQGTATSNGAQQPQPIQNAAAPANYGQPTNYGTPSNAGYPEQQQHYYQHQPQTAAADPYQTMRTQQTDQLNGLVNQTWGQSPQSPPYGVTPPATVQHYQSATSFTPAPANATPVQYNQRHRRLAGGTDTTGRLSSDGRIRCNGGTSELGRTGKPGAVPPGERVGSTVADHRKPTVEWIIRRLGVWFANDCPESAVRCRSVGLMINPCVPWSSRLSWYGPTGGRGSRRAAS